MLRAFAAFALAVALGACASAPPPQRTVPVATAVAYQHVPSGMMFPPELGGFVRTEVYPGRAGSDGVAVGYAYRTPTGPMLVTVTIELSPSGAVDVAAIDPRCRDIFQKRKDDIGGSNVQVRWIEDKDIALRLAGETQPAMMTSFDYEFRGEPMRGYLYVACYVGRDWSLHYRVTAPRDPKVAAVAASFIAALPGAPLHPAEKAER